MAKVRDNGLGMKLEAELDEILGVDVQNLSAFDSGHGSRKKGRKKYIILAGLAVVLVAAGTVAGVYTIRAQAFKTKFFPGTTINSVDCSNLTSEEVENLIRTQVEKYSLTLSFRGGEQELIDGKDIDYEYVEGTEVSQLLASQDIMNWYRESRDTREYTVASNTTYDEEKLAALLQDMDAMQDKNQVEPEDAYLEYEDGNFKIINAKEGSQLDREAFTAAVQEAITSGKTELSAEELDLYAKPAVTEDSESLIQQASDLNSYAAASITYDLPGGEKVLDGDTFVKWLDKDENGNYTRDDEKFTKKIKEYVAKMAEETDTFEGDIDFTATDGSNVKVTCRDYGWQIDQEKEAEALKKLIYDGEKTTREPEYIHRMATTDNGGFGDTYIEVNLTRQHMYYYQEGRLIFESDFVSGKMTKDRYTPTGVYLLDYKQKDRTLRGRRYSNGDYSYESHVNYWMPFHGGYGFHDATWRPSFGGSIYVHSGSHGCVNLPLSKAKALYEIINDEVPIVIFYTHSYTLGAAEPFVDRTEKKDDKKDDKEDEDDEDESSSKDGSSSKDKDESSSKDKGNSSSKDKGNSSSKDKGDSSSKDNGSSSKTETPETPSQEPPKEPSSSQEAPSQEPPASEGGGEASQAAEE
ncbi:MAG TPA: hypothetical protein DF613_14840 [Lachnospiraceae bacterium]|nr:hypothetical protein [Lachnospiraceae bacterium]